MQQFIVSVAAGLYVGGIENGMKIVTVDRASWAWAMSADAADVLASMLRTGMKTADERNAIRVIPAY